MHVWQQLEPYLPETLIPRLYPIRTLLDREVLEIRLRCGRPTQLIFRHGFQFLGAGEDVFSVFEAEAFLARLLEYSAFRHETERRQGYVTLPGGHRVGFAGRSFREHGRTAHITEPSSFNIRIARHVPGASGDLAERIYREGVLHNTLIFSPPGRGKTTVLRDLCERLTLAPYHLRAAVLDERGEIASCLRGEPMLPVGHADVLTGFPKSEGAELAIRTLNPEILLMDELAPGDGPVLEFAASSGVAVIATAHGGSREELFAKPELCSVIRKNFRYTAEIQGPGASLRLLEVGEEA